MNFYFFLQIRETPMAGFYGLLRVVWSLFDSKWSIGSRDIVNFVTGRCVKNSASFVHKKWYGCECALYIFWQKTRALVKPYLGNKSTYEDDSCDQTKTGDFS
jgi:hypothetical protein